jgi:hypothetical protein
MGGQISKLLTSLIWAKKEIRILILGLVGTIFEVGVKSQLILVG